MFFQKFLKQLARVIPTIKSEYILNNSISKEISSINIARLYYIAIITLPVSFIHIVLFYLKDVNTENELFWKWGVVLVHSFLFLFMVVFSIILTFLRNRNDSFFVMSYFPFIFLFVLLAAGITLVSIDQYITTNITPFIVICVVSAIILYMRPLVSISFYLIAYFLFYHAIGLIQKQEAILLTNRVNGISVIGIGFCISIILWHSNRLNLFQKREIENQHIELLKKNRLLEEANHELENLSILDELTQIFNRRYFNYALEKELKRHYRSQKPISLIICDVDFFKNYNDALGHLEGDKCLKYLANTIKESIKRPFDSAIRFGGEEFVIILPNTDEIGVMTVANRIKNRIADLLLRHPDSNISPFVTMSFGITTIIPDESTNNDYLIAKADEALFESKRSGRNKITKK